MDKSIKVAKDLAATLALLALAYAAVCAGRAARSVQADVTAAREHLDRDLIVLGATLTDVEKAARGLEAESQSQGAYWRSTMTSVEKIAADADATTQKAGTALDTLNTTLANLDVSVNKEAIPQVVKEFGDSSQSLSQNMTELVKETQPVMDSAARMLSDPAIAASLKNLEVATANTATTTKHVEETTADLETYAHRLVAPASAAKRAGAAIARYVMIFFGAWTGSK